MLIKVSVGLLLINESKQQVAVAVNSTMSMLYWRIGLAINEEVKRSEGTQNYGKQVVATLWRQAMLYERTAISKKPEQTIADDLELLKSQPAQLFFEDWKDFIRSTI